MKIILFDGAAHLSLFPITATKPVAKLRIGILTIAEKWQKRLNCEVSIRTKDYLEKKFNANHNEADIGILSAVLPDDDLVEALQELKKGQVLLHKKQLIAISPMPASDADLDKTLSKMEIIEYTATPTLLNAPWDIFKHNPQEIEKDFDLITQGRTSATLNDTNTIIGNRLFVEQGAKVNCAVINTTEGAVYIGKDAEIMEGSLVRGSLALCDNAVLKMGAKIYGGTTIGKYSKVGGEVGNSVIQDYTNKGHDGYLGNSVLGEWCNLGADTNTSNLKNNYSNVRVWSYKDNKPVDTGLQFCGLIMGDHSKSGINTMFNTGTVSGVFANIFGGDFPQKFIPSFSWGGAKGWDTYKLDKAFEVAERVMKRRNVELTEADKEIIRHLFAFSKQYRKTNQQTVLN